MVFGMRPLTVCLFLLWSGAGIAQDQTLGPCSPDHTRATWHTGVAAGNIYIQVTLTNVSDATCTLAGSPRIVAVNSGGEEAPLEVRWPVGGADLEKGRESVAVNAKGQAVFVIRTTDKTGLPESACADALRIYLPGSPASRPVARIVAQSCGAIEVSGYQILN
jgi:hypothetical protein